MVKKSPVQRSPAGVVGRSAVDAAVAESALRMPWVAQKPRQTSLKTMRYVVRAQNDFEEQPPFVTVTGGVVPPAAPNEMAEGDPDALKRLKDRSAKERWEQIHLEWLRNRKLRDAQKQAETAGEQPKSAPPAAEQALPGDDAANPFESGIAVPPAVDPGEPAEGGEFVPMPAEADTGNTLTPAVPAGDGVTRPGVAADKVFLQSQQKQPPKRDTLPTDEELSKLLNADNGQRLPPPVRDPAALPDITTIIPNPADRTTNTGRPVPEQDEKRYVKFDKNTPYVPRSNPEFTYNYQAANVWANPLYFEDPHLERYGHTLHPIVQPFASTGLFAFQIAGLPYQMAINPPTEKVYPLGWYSPGDYVPYRLRQIPLSLKATAVEAGVILGLQFATP